MLEPMMHFLRTHVHQDISLDTVLTVLTVTGGFIGFFIMRYWEHTRERKLANREIYQRLELASNELFRFDGEFPQVGAPLYNDAIDIPDSKAAPIQHNAFINYVCQILNLFEMAARFRDEGVIPPAVFGSWVTWFYDVCSAKNFRPVWEEVRMNYTCELRMIIEAGLRLAEEHTVEKNGRRQFFLFVARRYRCRRIREWLDCKYDRADSAKTCPECVLPTKVVADRACPAEVDECSSPAEAGRLAAFFVKNVDNKYISHGELQDGRTSSLETWPSNLMESMEAEFAELLASTSTSIFVARQGRDLVGLAIFRIRDDTTTKYGVLEDLVVQRGMRGSGIGKKLLYVAESCAKARDLKYIFLESGFHNGRAHAFFKRHGYGECSVVMSKQM